MGEKARRARKKGRDRETGIRLDAPVEIGISGDWPTGPQIVAVLMPAGAKGAVRRWPSVDAMLDAVAPRVAEVRALLDKSGSGRPVVVSRPDEVSTVHVNGLDGTPPDVRTAVRKALVVLDNLPAEARAEVERIGAIKARVARDGTGGEPPKTAQ